ncbi:MAG: Fur family transcriptional regulator [Candidatus Paceibacterota bacterium]
MRITKLRSQILAVLEKSDEALSASDIHQSLPHINLVTVYRNLDTFTQAGLVKKLNFGEHESVYEVQKNPHHHAICDECNKIIHFTFKEKALIQSLSLPGFDICNLEFLVRGKCRNHNTRIRA